MKRRGKKPSKELRALARHVSPQLLCIQNALEEFQKDIELGMPLEDARVMFGQRVSDRQATQGMEDLLRLQLMLLREMNQKLYCASLVSYILPREGREEWLGDLREARYQLVNAGYPGWAVSLITWGRIALLFWSLIKVKYHDSGFPKKQQRE